MEELVNEKLKLEIQLGRTDKTDPLFAHIKQQINSVDVRIEVLKLKDKKATKVSKKSKK
jgi:hypothetical protein